MKKFICMAALAAMVLSGCSSGSDSSASSSQAASSQTSSESSSQASSSSEQTSEEAQAELDALKEKMFTDGTNFPQLEEPEKGEEIAVFTTNKGVIKIKLCPEEAPKAVENFKGLINEGYYDGLTFHRVINGFMIQGGDPNGDGTGGESIWGGKFEDEYNGDMYHFRGALAYANSGIDTNGSQFYIVQSPAIEEGYFDYIDQVVNQYGDSEILYDSNSGKIVRTNYSDKAKEEYNSLGGTPYLDFGYTVFGQVIEGMDVVDAIAAVETDDSDKPTEDVIIEKAEIVKYE